MPVGVDAALTRYDASVPAALRIIDANLNRTREALRVLEDLARLDLGDAVLSRDLKSARHALRDAQAAAGLDPRSLVLDRDTPGDVGTRIDTAQEHQRGNAAEVAIAAGKRAGEGLRVLEETVKTLPGRSDNAAGAFKALRYRVYELEKRVLVRLGSPRRRAWGVCVLLSEHLCTHHPWERVAELAIEGGAAAVQLREKAMDGGELLRRARRLVEIAGGRAAVIVNDRPDVAALAGADGVHVGQGDLPALEARRIVGFDRLVGVSTSNLSEARAAADAGADVCGVGPMFPTTTKHKPVLAGPAYLRAYLADERLARIPHLAIGGITPENVGELVAAGCRGVAVSSVVCGAREPGAVCAALASGIVVGSTD